MSLMVSSHPALFSVLRSSGGTRHQTAWSSE
ncbi:hypothetical protein CPT_Magnus_032 [Klebsiella phage Magnus]|uniref:Uncharacterized protein n=1 Tax=Klebsiella phage Magnus TaxID=2589660 RepID=A0A5B9N8V3_9CAUD|nr:hypothetical protein HYP92_gp209 [Klebsiella phage Magnus]QEG07911.1 hypothetical protein CPT_Magnus_032 [Klebsiella phage Magnus]